LVPRSDRVFQATQDISFNEKLIASSESTVRTCEQELDTLRGIELDSQQSWLAWLFFGGKSAARARTRYLLDKMLAAEMKIEALERKNVELKKVLALCVDDEQAPV
jgi:hypothetical protein